VLYLKSKAQTPFYKWIIIQQPKRKKYNERNDRGTYVFGGWMGRILHHWRCNRCPNKALGKNLWQMLIRKPHTSKNMKEKLRNFVTAAQIISQLPAGEIKNKAVEELFGKSLIELGLPVGSYIYRKTDVGSEHVHQFIFSGDDGDCDVAISATVGSERAKLSIVADIK